MSNNYWVKRATDSVLRAEKAARNRIPEMIAAFKQTKADIEREIYAFYGRYAINNRVSLADARKALSRKELLEYRGNLKEFNRLTDDSIGTFNLALENASMKVRVTRLDALLIQIDAKLQELYQAQKNIIQAGTEAVTVEEYYHSHYDISVTTGKVFVFSKIPQSFISEVLSAPVEGADISTRLWRQDLDAGFFIRQTLTKMFVEGRPPQDFAADLARKIGNLQVSEGEVTGKGKLYEAYRLLYNESSYAMGQAHLKTYKETGVDLYEIIATLDTVTTPKCQSLDGCIFSVTKGGDVPAKYKKSRTEWEKSAYSTNSVVVGVNYPPFHVNCRTTTAPYFEGIDEEGLTRAARDPETGKTIAVPADMTYPQYYDKFIKPLPERGR